MEFIPRRPIETQVAILDCTPSVFAVQAKHLRRQEKYKVDGTTAEQSLATSATILAGTGAVAYLNARFNLSTDLEAIYLTNRAQQGYAKLGKMLTIYSHHHSLFLP